MRTASEFVSWVDTEKTVPLDMHLLDTAKVAEGLLRRDWISVAERFGLDDNLLKYAAVLHDIGKAGFYRIEGDIQQRPSELADFQRISRGRDFLPFWFHEILSALYVQCLEIADSLNYRDGGVYMVLKLAVLFHHFGMKNRYKLQKMLKMGVIKIDNFIRINEKGEIYRYILDFQNRKIGREWVSLDDLIEEMNLILASSGFPATAESCNVLKALEHLKVALVKYSKTLYPSTFALLGFLSIADSLAASLERGKKWEPTRYASRIASELGVSYEDLRSLLQD